MELHIALLISGGLLLLGLVADELGRRTHLPRVTLLMLFGVAAGPSGFDLLPKEFQSWYDFLTAIGLTMVAFLLGGTLSVVKLRQNGKAILFVSIAAVSVTALIVSFGLIALGTPVILAILLAGIATATAPAATQDVLHQLRAKGPFTDTLLGVVAVDDAWGLIIFSLLLVAAKSFAGDSAASAISHGLWEIGGALAIGSALGLPAAWLTGRLKPGEPMQTEALGLVLLCAGLAIWLEVSFLLAGMVAGAIVANFAEHHTRPFHEIENIEWPFMVLFFVMAGSILNISSLFQIGIIGIAYIFLRTISRIMGGWLGGFWAGIPNNHRNWIGFALVPQAGVALGMALVASTNFPELKEVLMAITIGTTVVFELVGPLLTQWAINSVGESRKPRTR